MFETREDYARAMLEGRKFMDGVFLCEWNGKTFNRGGSPYSIFNSYADITEILPEPKPFDPIQGEEIIVGHSEDFVNNKRIFIGKFNEYFMCVNTCESMAPTAWQFANPIQEENPWIKNDGKPWPGCKPTDKIEYKLGIDTIFTDIAGDLRWVKIVDKSDITKWRLKK